MKKPLSTASKRLQSMILELQCYRYDLNVVHKPGKEIPVTDCLSRNLVKDAKPIPDVAVHQLMGTLPLSDPRLVEIRTKTATDQNLQVLKHFILTGWPNQRKDCPTTIMEHWNHRNQLVYQDDMILKGDHIVIPKEMRSEMVVRVHQCHLGIEKCHARACMALFWPGMNADIEQTVANCDTCQMHRTANTKETLVNHPIPNLLWEMVASDLFTLDGRGYVLVVTTTATIRRWNICQTHDQELSLTHSRRDLLNVMNFELCS